MDSPVLEVSSISMSFGTGTARVKALADVSLSLYPGEILCLLGSNGAGKTSLIKAMAGLCKPSSGKVHWYQHNGPSGKMFSKISVMIEGRGGLNERCSLIENAKYYCRLREVKFDISYFNLLANRFGIADSSMPVRFLSNGNRLKCGLIVALIHKPEVVILDEPTLGLDQSGQTALKDLANAMAAQGTAFIFSSHDLDFVESLRCRLVCLRAGTKVFDGSVRQYLQGQSNYVVSFTVANAVNLPEGRYVIHWLAPGQAQVCLRSHEALQDFLVSVLPCFESLTDLSIQPVTLRERHAAVLATMGVRDVTSHQ
jgi:ABC-2 type transport system ATP-binding protein